ncbi:MAG TPA: ABC transporter permease [Chloroflexota bacterium]|nr:ABC transporter permease [Chloroflexota bacterium]
MHAEERADQAAAIGTTRRRSRRRASMVRDRVLSIILPLIALAVVFGFWQFFVVWQNIGPYIFPRLDTTLASLRDNWPHIWSSLLITLEETAAGFVLANLLAIAGASLFVYSRTAERTLFPIAVIVQTIPIIVWSPILVIVMPTDSLYPQIAIAFLISFFPALVNMSRGLREVDPLLLELFRVLHASSWQVYAKLRWPAAIPALFTSLRITSTLSLIGAIVGEYVAGGGTGLGYALIEAKQSIDTAQVMAIVLVASCAGIVIFLTVAAIERLVLSRRGQQV